MKPEYRRYADSFTSSSPDTSQSGETRTLEEPQPPRDMAVRGSAGADRARGLLNGIPDRFNDFCHMDMFTFVQLADWILDNAESSTAEEDISVEESLFVFLDIVAQGNSFRSAAYEWDHDIKLTQNIFLNVLNALRILREKEDISPSCPPFSATKSRWRILHAFRPKAKKARMNGLVKIGEDLEGDGIEVDQESLIEAITALNNFIHERNEL